MHKYHNSIIKSSLCRQRDFSSDWYQKWREEILLGAPELEPERQAVWGTVWEGMQGKWMHRKLWEWCIITQALSERGMLTEGKKGIGFAVGQEPLTSLFAKLGSQIVATDMPQDEGPNEWVNTGQYAASDIDIRWPKLISQENFNQKVVYEGVDMRDTSKLPSQSFDFLWSSCAFEHLGSLEHGLSFVRNSLDVLKPGGIAVHTTEYNVSSNNQTIEVGGSVIYRKNDIEELDRSLRSMGCAIEELDFEAGAEPHDIGFDFPPYYKNGRQHIKLSLDGHISTSLLLIIRKAC